jgi:hypothetical protein
MTNWANCHPPYTMTFEIAGMYPSATYQMYSQTKTGTKITPGPTVSFKTGVLPSSIPFPTFKATVTGNDTTAPVILHNLVQLGGGTRYPDVATDLAGHVIWFYYPNDSSHAETLARPLPNGTMLTIQDGTAWNPAGQAGQFLREIDFAGNVVRETNTGVIQQELLAMKATDGGPCNAITTPVVGSACLGAFHHDAIQTLPNGYTAVIADIEKIYPAGTQGDTSGLPVDIVGDMIIVLDANWQVFWWFDTFLHAGGAPELDINRPAVLGETCGPGQTGCPPMFLLSPGVIAPHSKDWLHANSLYYWPKDGSIIWSSRHQDWVMKVDYNNGTGTGNILWRMGPGGDFNFNNIYQDPWPWFSHQHDVGIENGGTGVMTIFDNGNTRVSQLGPGNSRGMALTVDETPTHMQVTPVLSVDLGVYSTAMASAQLLADGNYFFQPAIVVVTLSQINGYSIEILPTVGTDTGTQILNLQGPEHYRGWQMPNLYSPPTT